MIIAKNKKAIISITTFSLIISLMVLFFVGFYNFYLIGMDNIAIKTKNQEVLNSILVFRSNIIDLYSIKNLTIIYENKNDLNSINISLYTNGIIMGKDISTNELIEINISSFGISFCSNYSFYPSIKNSFNFNGSCISKI